jgi:hypothetical protein
MKKKGKAANSAPVLKSPIIVSVPKTAEELLQYQILLASSSSRRHQRIFRFAVVDGDVEEMKVLCTDPRFNYMLPPAKKAQPQRVGIMLSYIGGNIFELEIHESCLLATEVASQRLKELDRVA